MKYLVSHQGQESGPHTLQEIVEKVRAKQLEMFDYIYDEEKGDWVLLMEHGGLTQLLKTNKPSRPPEIKATEPAATTTTTATTTTVTKDTPHTIEWFVLKGENRFGPFAYADVVRMLQQKVVFPFDFIWHAGMRDWKRVAEISEFQPETIRTLVKNREMGDVFLKRQFKRQQFTGRVLIHDNFKLWKAEGFEISQGGVGVRMSHALIVPGQQVNVHFKAQEGWPAFNALCEVVSKKFVSDNSPVEYGMRFLSMSPEAQDEFQKKVA